MACNKFLIYEDYGIIYVYLFVLKYVELCVVVLMKDGKRSDYRSKVRSDYRSKVLKAVPRCIMLESITSSSPTSSNSFGNYGQSSSSASHAHFYEHLNPSLLDNLVHKEWSYL